MLLQKNPYVQQGTLKGYSGAGLTWTGATGGFNEMYIRNNVVRVISLTPSPSMTVGKIVDRYGNPEKVLPWYAIIPENVSLQYRANLYYPRNGLVVFFYTTRPTDGTHLLIEPDLIIDKLHYLPSGSLEEVFGAAQGTLPLDQWGKDARNRLQDWNGYGAYEFSTDPLRP